RLSLFSSRSSYLHNDYPHSFPTRRSSDLDIVNARRFDGSTAATHELKRAALPQEIRRGANRDGDRLARLIAADRNGAVQVHVVVDRKSIRLNSSHVSISYGVFCLKKKTNP